jgi:hypothetical protein
LEIPAGGWTAAAFARHGVSLIRTMARVAQITQRKAIPFVAKSSVKIFTLQINEIARRVENRFGIRKSTILKIDVQAAFDQAIAEVFADTGWMTQAELMPPIQSVMAQGYDKTARLLAQEADAANSPAIARHAQEIAAKVTRVNETTRTQIRQTVERSLDRNATVADTIGDLRAAVPDLTHGRSMTIARTELNNAWTQGSAQAFRENHQITHLSVIGCEAREERSPHYHGQSTCNFDDLPIHDLDVFLSVGFHPNHTGTLIPSGFRE